MRLQPRKGDKMGTSKGYIAPSTPYWSRAKRSVTSYLGNPSDNKRNSAASGYAKAMGSAGFSNNRAVHAFSGIASFAAFSGANGYQAALREIGRDDIFALPPEEALSELMHAFANDGATIDDAIALDCMSEALTVLEIQSPEQLSTVDINRLIKELVCQFAKHKFAQLFDKQIRNKFPNVEEANIRITEMQEYIYYTMELKLTPEILSTINPESLANEPVIQETMTKGFEFLEEFYGE